MMMTRTENHRENGLCAVLLVGGFGTRLRAVVPSAPKPLATVGNKSFLELLVNQLRHQGIRRLVMCTGYLADQIEQHFGDGRNWDVTIKYSRELEPLGTAGAVMLARKHIGDRQDFLVMNGDSFIEVDFSQLASFHKNHDGPVSMVVRQVENAGRYGTVQVGGGGRVARFAEKTGIESTGLVNAGVYIFRQAIFEYLPNGPGSLEKEVFPKLLTRGIYALEQNGMFIDIGTPEDYQRAQQLSVRLNEAASSATARREE